MSQDLLAAFGEATVDNSGRNLEGVPINAIALKSNPLTTVECNHHSAEATGVDDDFEDDDFGDFEDASVASKAISTSAIATDGVEQLQPDKSVPQNPPPFRKKETQETHGLPLDTKKIGQHPFAGHMDLLFDAGDDEYDAGTDELADLATNPEAAMAFSKKLVEEQLAAREKSRNVEPLLFASKERNPIAESGHGTVKDRQFKASSVSSPVAKNSMNTNILFDAEDPSTYANDDGDNNDWEDFEQSGPKSSVEDDKTSNDTAKKNAMENATKKAQSQNVPKTRAILAEFDEWDDFEAEIVASQPVGSVGSSAKATNQSAQPLKTFEQPTSFNIPPPLLLISLFPALFAAADEALFSSLTKLPPRQHEVLLAHPATVQFLQAYIGNCIAFAYIIAGRKLRWKRDQHLAQSMKIGPAASGSKGGMKLVGLDKAESAKEDREVLEAVQLYRKQMGKAQSAVAGTKSRVTTKGSKLSVLKVPNVNETMVVRSLKPTEGGITAARPCAICGLKRNERVVQIDREVEDSFGEWWVEDIGMHVVCKLFWEKEGKKLRGR